MKDALQIIPDGFKVSFPSIARPQWQHLSWLATGAWGMSLVLYGTMLSFPMYLVIEIMIGVAGLTGRSRAILSLLLWAPVATALIVHLFWAKKYLLLSKDTMRIGDTLFGQHLFREARYPLKTLKNFRLTPRLLLFDHESPHGINTIEVSHYGSLDQERPLTLLRNLSDIIAYQCHTVERIVFGHLPAQQFDPVTTRVNPDVENLTVPFLHLTQIHIETTTADVYLTERFLTYAVNTIGQEYLKKHVAVYFHGDPERLQANLRNALTNLCKQITLYDEQNDSGVNAYSYL